ncbi:hypothetical protein H4219_004692 [Mycoemilia scoparia]|uniref:Glutathione S-transferase n=1 Tax=Mycoemilia scoparia TaxID=417184 RepID=A0A9W8DQQ7_9FUNG|nr:hypothetical protein H4219_004692 [Mycoemilia scoparia]
MSSSSTSQPDFAPNKLTLYDNPICPYAQRAVVALKETNTDYHNVYIDFKNKPEWYTKVINPQGKVPALRLEDGTILIESLIIAEYVVDRFDRTHKLLPSDDPKTRAQIRLFTNHYDTAISPNVYGLLRAATSEEQQQKTQAILDGLAQLNQLLVQQSPEGPFFLGNQFSFAEIVVAPLVVRLIGIEYHRGFKIPQTKEYARLNQWIKAFKAHPSIKESTAEDSVFIEGFKKFLPGYNPSATQ